MGIVDAILAQSPSPPVIVIQADHGPRTTKYWGKPSPAFLRERMSILSAFYLPGNPAAPLYESITPVNSFRVIFNRYFNTNYPLLDDLSWFTVTERPLDFTNVTESRR